MGDKVSAVEKAIKGLKNGTIDPSQEIIIDGIETEEQIRKKEEEKRVREKKQKVQKLRNEREKKKTRIWQQMYNQWNRNPLSILIIRNGINGSLKIQLHLKKKK